MFSTFSLNSPSLELKTESFDSERDLRWILHFVFFSLSEFNA